MERRAPARHELEGTPKPAETVLGAPQLRIFNAVQPFSDREPALKWDGEWHITIEVFRDLGTAFAAGLVLIFILMVALRLEQRPIDGESILARTPTD